LVQNYLLTVVIHTTYYVGCQHWYKKFLFFYYCLQCLYSCYYFHLGMLLYLPDLNLYN